MRCYWSIDMLTDTMGHPETKEISGGIYTVLSVDRTKNYQLDLPFLLLLKTTGKHKHQRRRMQYLFSTKDLNVLEVLNLGGGCRVR